MRKQRKTSEVLLVSKAKLRERFQAKKAKVAAKAQQKIAAQREATRRAKEEAADKRRQEEHEAAVQRMHDRAAKAQAKHQAETEAIERQANAALQNATSREERMDILAGKEKKFAEARAELNELLRSIAAQLLDGGKSGPKAPSELEYSYLSQREMQTRSSMERPASAYADTLSTSPTYERVPERRTIRQRRFGA